MCQKLTDMIYNILDHTIEFSKLTFYWIIMSACQLSTDIIQLFPGVPDSRVSN